MAWTIDPAHTTVGFSARHMGLSTVRGRFIRFNGTIDVDPNDLATAGGRIEVEMASVDTGEEQRDNHLRSPDFFDVERFPTMSYVVKSVTSKGAEHYEVVGDLTIKDVTREVMFDLEYAGEATDPYGNRRVGGSLTTTLKRSDWDLKWNVPLDTGGWLVSDSVQVEIEGQLTESRQAAEQEADAEAQL